MDSHQIYELEKYADLDGSELGEYCIALISVYNRRDYASPEFETLLDEELSRQLTYFKENCEIVERTETFTRKIRDLEWNK